MPFPEPPYFPHLYPRKKERKMDYRQPRRSGTQATHRRTILSHLRPCSIGSNGVRTHHVASGAKGARPVRATSGQRGDHTGVKGVACSAPTETPRTHRVASVHRSVEKGYRVGAAVLRGRRCGRQAGKEEITPATRALHAAPLRKPRGRIAMGVRRYGRTTRGGG